MKIILHFKTSALILLLILINTVLYAKSEKTGIQWLVEPQFMHGGDFSEGMAAVYKEGKYGYLNSKGEIVIEPQFNYAHQFSEGLASVQINNSYGYINTNGKILINPQYKFSSGFSEGLASVKMGTVYGFINKDGITVIKPQFENTKAFFEGYAEVQRDGKWYLIDRNGNLAEKPAGLGTEPSELGFDRRYLFSEGLILISKNSRYGFMNMDGKIVIQPKYFRASYFSEGLASVQTYDKTGYIDTKGVMVIQEKYLEGGDFSEGLARIITDYKTGKWGFIDRKGKLVIDAGNFDLIKRDILEESRNFSEGLFPVRKNGKWGYIDSRGNIIIEPQFDTAKRFSEGFALVSNSGRYGYIKNPLTLSDMIDSFNRGRQMIGIVKSVSGNEIIVSGSDIAKKVFIGDKLCVYSKSDIILLRSTFPMMTVSKCEVIAGARNNIKAGLKVYKYKKDQKESR